MITALEQEVCIQQRQQEDNPCPPAGKGENRPIHRQKANYGKGHVERQNKMR